MSRHEPVTIKSVVAHVYGISLAQLESPRRTRHLVRARQVAAHLMRSMLPMTMDAIGIQLGGRDHTTISWGLKHLDRILENPQHYHSLMYAKCRTLLDGDKPMEALKLDDHTTRPITSPQVIAAVCRVCEMAPDDLLSDSREHHVVEAKRMVTVVLRDHAQMSYPSIAHATWARAHSTSVTHYTRARNNMSIGFGRKLRAVEELLGVGPGSTSMAYASSMSLSSSPSGAESDASASLRLSPSSTARSSSASTAASLPSEQTYTMRT